MTKNNTLWSGDNCFLIERRALDQIVIYKVQIILGTFPVESAEGSTDQVLHPSTLNVKFKLKEISLNSHARLP